MIDTHDNFIFSKSVDRSLLRQGFTLPAKMLWKFTEWFGELKPGSSKTVVVRLGGEKFLVKLGNRNFNRQKWPDHPEMYQMRYNDNCDFSKRLKLVFCKSREYIEQELKTRLAHGEKSRRHILMPKNLREQLLFFRTDNPCVWDAEVITAADNEIVAQDSKSLDERFFESDSWFDDSARIVLKPALVKVRRLDRAIGNNLKRIYGHRCQFCGKQVGEVYSTFVDEVHHIDPFIKSLNNDVSNLLVLCPTHHRVIHSAHPFFSRTNLSYVYPNGFVERIKLNFHLK